MHEDLKMDLIDFLEELELFLYDNEYLSDNQIKHAWLLQETQRLKKEMEWSDETRT